MALIFASSHVANNDQNQQNRPTHTGTDSSVKCRLVVIVGGGRRCRCRSSDHDRFNVALRSAPGVGGRGHGVRVRRRCVNLYIAVFSRRTEVPRTRVRPCRCTRKVIRWGSPGPVRIQRVQRRCPRDPNLRRRRIRRVDDGNQRRNRLQGRVAQRTLLHSIDPASQTRRLVLNDRFHRTLRLRYKVVAHDVCLYGSTARRVLQQ